MLQRLHQPSAHAIHVFQTFHDYVITLILDFSRRRDEDVYGFAGKIAKRQFSVGGAEAANRNRRIKTTGVMAPWQAMGAVRPIGAVRRDRLAGRFC